MLILTRRVGETLCIGDDVEVTVIAVNGNQVRVGIKAPRNVIVDREEIAQRKRSEGMRPKTLPIGAPIADAKLQRAGQGLARATK